MLYIHASQYIPGVLLFYMRARPTGTLFSLTDRAQLTVRRL
jgi:hypothetical protein